MTIPEAIPQSRARRDRARAPPAGRARPSASTSSATRSSTSSSTPSARTRATRSTTTGSSPRRSPRATRSSSAGWRPRAAPTATAASASTTSPSSSSIGRLLFDALGNLGLVETAREALAELGVDLDRLRKLEPDAALGNGGLGRLAACFMESLSTLRHPGHGYGIRYDHGIFRQAIKDGWQIELPEDWLSSGNPWEFERPEVDATPSASAARVETPCPTPTARRARCGTRRQRQRGGLRHADRRLARRAREHAAALVGARRPTRSSLEDFNRGDHVGALADRVRLEAISRVLYPSDDTPAGHELRLRQEIFFASASLQDILRRHQAQHGELSSLPDHVAIQLNDTHPAIAIPELMRLLVDEHGMPWDARLATSRRRSSTTPTTRCCPRRSRSGRCR